MKSPTPTDPPRLHFRSHGDGDPPLVLVHGFGAHAHFWRHWVPHLAARHRTHVIDLLGAGESPIPPDGDLSPQGQARAVATLIRDLAGPPPVLIGHSLGAGISLLATILLREEAPRIRLPGLVLVSGAVLAQRLPPYLTLARTPGLRRLLALAAPPRPLLRLGLRGIVHRPSCIDREMIDGYRAPFRTPARRRAFLRAAGQIDMAAAEALARRLPEIEVPTLLLWGEEDPVVPVALGRRLAGELRDARLVVLPGVGHLPPEEDPERSVEAVLDFLSALPGASRDAPE